MTGRRWLPLLAWLVGCGGYAHRPLAPALHAVPAPGAAGGSLRVSELALEEDAGTKVTVTVAAEGPARASLRRALLAPAAAAPCSGGWEERSALLDDQAAWRRPLALTGGQRLHLTFKDAGAALDAPSALDLELDGPDAGCLRLPVTTAAPADRWSAGRWWLTLALRSYFPLREQAAAHDGHTGVLRFGRFLGPVNAGLSLEAGAGHCAGGCVSEGYFGLIAGGPSLAMFLLDRGRFVLGLEAAYDFLWLSEQRDEDESSAGTGAAAPDRRSLFLHGPRLGLGFFRATRPAARALPAPDRRALVGAELFLALRLHSADAATEHALVLGVSLALGGPL
jgi:hypothetical protein